MDSKQVAHCLNERDIVVELLDEHNLVCRVPGENRKQISFVISIRPYSLMVETFVARRPEDNREQVLEWLLEQNQKLRLNRFAVDQLGDIYLFASFPIQLANEEVLDAIIGELVSTTDQSFNAILKMGFASAIDREFVWRKSRGLETTNLDHLRYPFSN